MGKTRQHDSTPDQIGFCDVIPNLATTNFKTSNGEHFNVDNENETAVVLRVKFARSDAFISKKFLPGPNPYLLKEIEANAVLTAPELANLKYGY